VVELRCRVKQRESIDCTSRDRLGCMRRNATELITF